MPAPTPLTVPIAPPPTHSVGGQRFATMLRASDTGGRYSLMHFIVPVDGCAPGHYHERYEETFLVLAGALDFEIDTARLLAEPGMWVRAPAGARHAYTNRGVGDAQMLVAFTPGGIEELFEEFADPIGSEDGPSKIDRSLREYVEKARSIYGTEYEL